MNTRRVLSAALFAVLASAVLATAALAGSAAGHTGSATIEVRKVLSPANDAGRFNLLVRKTRSTLLKQTSNIGNGGSTGRFTIPSGQLLTVEETAAGGTKLANYKTMVECHTGTGPTGPTVATRNGTGVTLTPNAGMDYTCTFTNTRTGTTTTPTTTPTPPPHTSTVCGLDVVWLQSSIQGDLFEIAGGKLALSKSQNPQVRLLATTLINDHSKSLEEAKKLAVQLGITAPTEPTPSQQWEIEELAEMSVQTFNHDYSELEVADHLQDIQDSQNEVKLGCNPDVKNLAQQDIPTLQKHLALAKQALATAGSEDTGH